MGVYKQYRESYCDDCIHTQVCKYTKEVREYEEKRPVYGTGLGSVIVFAVYCGFKRVDDNK